MPIRFQCQQCQARVKVPDGSQGRRVKCPRCGYLQQVPRESEPVAHGEAGAAVRESEAQSAEAAVAAAEGDRPAVDLKEESASTGAADEPGDSLSSFGRDADTPDSATPSEGENEPSAPGAADEPVAEAETAVGPTPVADALPAPEPALALPFPPPESPPETPLAPPAETSTEARPTAASEMAPQLSVEARPSEDAAAEEPVSTAGAGVSESAPAVEDESAEGDHEANARQDEADHDSESSGASAAPDEVLLPNAQPLVEASGGAAELTIERPRPRTVVPPQPIPLSGSSAGAVGTGRQVAQHEVVKPFDASPTIATLPRKGAEATSRPDVETVARPAALGEPKPYAVLGALAWTLRGAAAIVGVAGVLAALADGSGESSRGILGEMPGGRLMAGLVVAVTVWTVGEMAAVVRDIARQQTRQ